ncbi:MAG: alpha/beta hydrolase [Ruminococcus sp.]|nr:alpha/beta hydrolase [Ruminococcus sp.]
MNRIIKAVAAKTALKIWHMKRSTKIALGVTAAATVAAAGVVAVKVQQAKKQERSVKSLMVEDAIRRLPIRSSAQESYEEALEQSSRPYVLPDFARNTIGMAEYDDFTDTFVLQPKERYSDYVIFYIHGHNFWADPSKVHFRFYRRLADTLGASLILPVYPKAPTYHVADVHQMLLERYQYLINEKKIDPQNIIFAGDAAGGGLVLSLLQRLKYQAIPMPNQAFLFSPWLDITNSNPDMRTVQGTDPLLNIDTLAFQGREYAGDVDLESPVVSPIYGDLKGLPPITVFTGTHDILNVDAINLEKIAEAQELDILVYTFVNQLHFFVGLPIPEAREALEIVAEEVFGVEECDECCDDTCCECEEEFEEEVIEDDAKENEEEENAAVEAEVVTPVDIDDF